MCSVSLPFKYYIIQINPSSSTVHCQSLIVQLSTMWCRMSRLMASNSCLIQVLWFWMEWIWVEIPLCISKPISLELPKGPWCPRQGSRRDLIQSWNMLCRAVWVMATAYWNIVIYWCNSKMRNFPVILCNSQFTVNIVLSPHQMIQHCIKQK